MSAAWASASAHVCRQDISAQIVDPAAWGSASAQIRCGNSSAGRKLGMAPELRAQKTSLRSLSTSGVVGEARLPALVTRSRTSRKLGSKPQPQPASTLKPQVGPEEAATRRTRPPNLSLDDAADRLAQSLLLGVSVGHLGSGFKSEVQEVFGDGVDPNFYEINTAMLWGQGPREVKLKGLKVGPYKQGVVVKQVQADGTQAVGRLKKVKRGSCDVTLVETEGTFSNEPLVQIAGSDAGAPAKVVRKLLNGWPQGRGLQCPRDGEQHASYVDAVHARGLALAVGRATTFLSWCWAYSVDTVISALDDWCQDTQRNPSQTYVWMCALCNNQFRVEEKKALNEVVPFESFQEVFQSRIRDIGTVVSLLDTWEDPCYVKRLWCNWELVTAVETKDVHLEIILPPRAGRSFREALEADPDLMERIYRSLDAIRSKNAKAKSKEDEQNIRAMIERGQGYEHLDSIVRLSLRKWFAEIAEHLQHPKNKVSPQLRTPMNARRLALRALSTPPQTPNGHNGSCLTRELVRARGDRRTGLNSLDPGVFRAPHVRKVVLPLAPRNLEALPHATRAKRLLPDLDPGA